MKNEYNAPVIEIVEYKEEIFLLASNELPILKGGFFETDELPTIPGWND